MTVLGGIQFVFILHDPIINICRVFYIFCDWSLGYFNFYNIVFLVVRMQKTLLKGTTDDICKEKNNMQVVSVPKTAGEETHRQGGVCCLS